MNLSAEDVALYFKVRKAVLAYASRQLGIFPQVVASEDIQKLSVPQISELSAAFYRNTELQDRYLAENPDHFSSGDLAIVASWKKRISGDFYIVRHLKAYTVFMSSEPHHLYGVLGLNDPIEDLIAGAPLPVMVKAVLLPFRDRIIYDGTINIYRITFGGGIRAELSRTYSRLKEKEGIVEGLLNVEAEEQIRTRLPRKLPAKPAPDWGPALGAILAEVEKMRRTDTPLQTAAIGLLRAAAGIAHSSYQHADVTGTKMRSLRRAMTHLENLLHERDGS